MEKDIVTLKEDNGDVMFVEEGHDVERVTVILKNPYCYEIYQETFVTRCGWRLACGASLPRTQCQRLLHRVNVFSMDWRIHMSSICRFQRSCCFFSDMLFFLFCWRQRDCVSSAHHDFLNPCATKKKLFLLMRVHARMEFPLSMYGTWLLNAFFLQNRVQGDLKHDKQSRKHTNNQTKIQTKRENLDLTNVDYVFFKRKIFSFWRHAIYFLQDNEAVIKMINEGRSPTTRHVSRTRRVALDWLFDRSTWNQKSKSNALTPKTNSQTYS